MTNFRSVSFIDSKESEAVLRLEPEMGPIACLLDSSNVRQFSRAKSPLKKFTICPTFNPSLQ